MKKTMLDIVVKIRLDGILVNGRAQITYWTEGIPFTDGSTEKVSIMDIGDTIELTTPVVATIVREQQ